MAQAHTLKGDTLTVTKKQNSGKKKGTTKVLKLKKETVKDLTSDKDQQVKGGKHQSLFDVFAVKQER